MLEFVGRWDKILSSAPTAETPSSSRPRSLSDLLRGLDVDEEICTSEPFCLYDPEWFGAPRNECPRITLSTPSQTSSPPFIPPTSLKIRSLFPPSRYRPSDLLQAPHPSAFLTYPLRITSSFAHDYRWAQLRLDSLSPSARMKHHAEQRREHARRKALRRMWCCFPEPEPRIRKRRGTQSSLSRPEVKDEPIVVHATFVSTTSVCLLDAKEGRFENTSAWRISEKVILAFGTTISRGRMRT